MRLGIILIGVTVTVLLTIASFLTAGWVAPPIDVSQSGYRGTGMAQFMNPDELHSLVRANEIPEAPYPLDAVDMAGPRASEVYENVQVLGDISVDQFDRLMIAMTEWVSPEEGCNYCHAVESLASDDIYTKVVSRRMIEMVRHINTGWSDHVAETGVTCYTCHRGNPVPEEIWFTEGEPNGARGMAGNKAGQNSPAESVGLTSLPYDPLTALLRDKENIRVASTEALPADNRRSIKQTELTYGLMVHMSEALGVNCTHCHNSRSFYDWAQSPPQRATAWHGIQMSRKLNVDYLEPLQGEFPPHRLGELGDVAKVNCATCHQGANKPLNGQSMVQDFPSLIGPTITTGQLKNTYYQHRAALGGTPTLKSPETPGE